MRILYSFPRVLGRAGVGTTAFQQITGLVDAGHELIVHAKESEVSLDGVTALTRTVPGRRASPARVLTRRHEREWHDYRVAMEVRRRRRSIDAVYAWPGASRRTFEAARRAGIPAFLEIANTHIDYQHSVLTKEAAALGNTLAPRYGDVLSAHVRSQYRVEYRLADFLLVPSEFARDTFVAHGHAPERLLLHRYGFDPDRFPERPAAGSSEPGRRPTILYLGRCELRKGLHFALKAWGEVEGHRRGEFVIAGAFDDDYAECLQPLLSGPAVRTVPFAPDPGSLMRAADIFVAPSIEEGSALVTYEAQASGCAVLASDACGARLGPLAASLVHSAGDWKRLAAAMHLLLDDGDRLIEVQSEARARRESLTWGEAGRELATMLVRALGGAAEVRRP